MSSLVGYSALENKEKEYNQAKKILKFQDRFNVQDLERLYVTYPSIQPQIRENQDYLIVAIGNVFLKTFEQFLKIWPAQKEKAFAALDGNFLICVKEKKTGDIWLAADIFATYPCYYFLDQSGFYFSSYLLALKEFLTEKKLNHKVFLQMLKFSFPANQETFYEKVMAVPYGSYVHYDQRQKKVAAKKYLDFSRVIERRTTANKEQLSAEIFEIFADEIGQRRDLRSKTEASFISGGMDTRTILAFLAGQDLDLQAYIHNNGDENDVYCAARIAAIVKAKLHIEYIPDDVLLRFSEATIKANDGMVNHLVATGYYLLYKNKENIKQIYDGFIAGDLFGSHIPDPDYAGISLAGVKEDIIRSYSKVGTRLFRPEAYQKLLDIFNAEADQFFKEFKGGDNFLLAELYSQLQRQVRHETGALQRARTMVDIKTPFASRRLFFALLSCPYALRRGQVLQKAILKKRNPLLFKAPQCKTRYLGYPETKLEKAVSYVFFRANNLRHKLKMFTAKEYFPDSRGIVPFKETMLKTIRGKEDILGQYLDLPYMYKNSDKLDPLEFSVIYLLAKDLDIYFK